MTSSLPAICPPVETGHSQFPTCAPSCGGGGVVWCEPDGGEPQRLSGRERLHRAPRGSGPCGSGTPTVSLCAEPAFPRAGHTSVQAVVTLGGQRLPAQGRLPGSLSHLGTHPVPSLRRHPLAALLERKRPWGGLAALGWGESAIFFRPKMVASSHVHIDTSKKIRNSFCNHKNEERLSL